MCHVKYENHIPHVQTMSKEKGYGPRNKYEMIKNYEKDTMRMLQTVAYC